MSVPKVKDEIDIEAVKSEQDDSQTPLRAYEILSYPADFTLEVLVDKITKGEIKSPKLQRRYIWPINRASKLIESFLLGLPVPPIFVYQDRDDGKLLIVDGHQRLRSIAYFFSGWFGEGKDPLREPFKLSGLSDQSPFSGVDFDQLKNTSQAAFNRLKNSVVRTFIMKQLQPENDDSSIIEVFERLNTGGMIAQGQEIRNCIYEGEFNELLKRLNEDKHWRKIMGTSAEDKRMRDVELILRFLALFHTARTYKKPMKVFLNNYMRANRRALIPRATDTDAKKLSQAQIEAIQNEFAERLKKFDNLFTQTAEEVVRYLGTKPFHVSKGLNAAVFDSVFTAFAHRLDTLRVEKITSANINHVNNNYNRLLKDADYLKLITSATTDKDSVTQRLDLARKRLFV